MLVGNDSIGLNRLSLNKLAVVRQYVRKTYGARWIRRIEQAKTIDPADPFRFNHLTGPGLLGCPRFIKFLDRMTSRVVENLGSVPISLVHLQYHYQEYL